MGARVYFPTLGRFAQADPVEGGTPNAYTYPPNPVNSDDLDGSMCMPKGSNPFNFFSCANGKEFESTAKAVVYSSTVPNLAMAGAFATTAIGVLVPGIATATATRAASWLWTSGTAGSGFANMTGHFTKHGASMGYKSATSYTVGAIRNIAVSTFRGALKAGTKAHVASNNRVTLTYGLKLASYLKSKDALRWLGGKLR